MDEVASLRTLGGFVRKASDFRARLETIAEEGTLLEASQEIHRDLLHSLFDIVPSASISLYAVTYNEGTEEEPKIHKPILGEIPHGDKYARHVITVFNLQPEKFYSNFKAGQDFEKLKLSKTLDYEAETLDLNGDVRGFGTLVKMRADTPLSQTPQNWYVAGYPNDWLKRGEKSLEESTLKEYDYLVRNATSIKEGEMVPPFEIGHTSLIFPIDDANGNIVYVLEFAGIIPSKRNELPEGLHPLLELAYQYRTKFLDGDEKIEGMRSRMARLVPSATVQEYIKDMQRKELYPQDFVITPEFVQQNAWLMAPDHVYDAELAKIHAELAAELKTVGRESYNGLPKPTEEEIQLLAQYFDYDEPVSAQQMEMLEYVRDEFRGVLLSVVAHDRLVRVNTALQQAHDELDKAYIGLKRAKTMENIAEWGRKIAHRNRSDLIPTVSNSEKLLESTETSIPILLEAFSSTPDALGYVRQLYSHSTPPESQREIDALKRSIAPVLREHGVEGPLQVANQYAMIGIAPDDVEKILTLTHNPLYSERYPDLERHVRAFLHIPFYTQEIHASSRRAHDSSERVLLAIRHEQDPEAEMNIPEFLDTVFLPGYRIRCADQDIELTTDYSGSHSLLRVNHPIFQGSLTYLMDNAVEAASEAKIKRIHVSVKDVEQGVETTLTNTWSGAYDLESVIRAGKSTKEKGSSTGLGAVQEDMRLLNGELHSSSYTEGEVPYAIFTILLPL